MLEVKTIFLAIIFKNTFYNSKSIAFLLYYDVTKVSMASHIDSRPMLCRGLVIVHKMTTNRKAIDITKKNHIILTRFMIVEIPVLLKHNLYLPGRKN